LQKAYQLRSHGEFTQFIFLDLRNNHIENQVDKHRRKNREEKSDEGKVVRKERFTGSCKRSWYVGDGIKDSDITAAFENGVLTISVPSETKKEEPKHIPVGDSDNSNRASTGSQNIQISMDAGKKKEPKPVEKHVHVYPENRSLTSEECELDLKKAQMEYDLKMKQEALRISSLTAKFMAGR
jgi:hypothetical protein